MKSKPELLLHPNIPKPLHGLAPRVILGRTWWDKKRHEAYEKHDLCCWACGVYKFAAKYHQWLEGHEHYDFNYKTGCLKLIEIVALCRACHNYIHSGRLLVLYESGKISETLYDAVIKHGEDVLRKAGYKKFRPNYPSSSVEWNKWHLLIDGKKYFSKFKNVNEWMDFYN